MKTKLDLNRIALLVVSLAAGLALCGGPGRASAATRIWDGGSATSGSWSIAANWAGNVAPLAGDFLVFPAAAARLVNTNNYAANTVFGGIIFQGDNYNIYGNAVTITNHITAEAGASGNVFRPDIRLGAPQQLFIRAQGSGLQLTVLGNLNLNGRDLTLLSQGELVCGGAISGVGDVSTGGNGRTVFSGIGANTYTGDTHVSGILELSKFIVARPSGARIPVTAVPGDLLIGIAISSLISDAVVCEADDQIAPDARVTVLATGELNLNGHNNSIPYLRLVGGHVTTGAGLLTIRDNILCEPDTDGSVISGQLDLGTTTVFNVWPNARLTVSAAISGGPTAALHKTSLGELRLLASNTYRGPTVLRAGTLALYNLHSLGLGTEPMTVEGGTLTLVDATISGRPVTFTSAATLASSGVSSTWRGTVALEAIVSIQTPANSTLTLHNTISGPGGFQKSGGGTCRLSGFTDNTFTGAATVLDGTLELDNFFNQQSFVAIPGSLVVGDGVGTSGSARVRHSWPGQMADTSQVTVNSDGVWDLNGWDDAVGGLTLAGGSVLTFAGTLTLGGDVQVNPWSSTATINGQLNLGDAPRTFTVADGAATYDLDLNATVSGGPASALVKAGPGVMRLVGDTPNTYPGQTVVNAGMLRLWKLPGLLSVPGDLMIGNPAGVPNSAIVTAHLDESIANTSTVTIHESGQLDLNGFNDTIGPLNLTGPGNVTTGVGTLILGGDVTVNQATASVIIAGNLSLGGATRTFHVANSLDFYDLRIPARISGLPGVGWIKDGEGLLRLAGANTFSGPAQVLAGGLFLEHSNALGATSAGTTLADGTFLTLALNVSVGAEPLALGDNTSVRFGSANNAWAGNIVLNGHTILSSVNLLPTDQLNLSGVVSGAGSLQLAGGRLLLSGNRPNTYRGATTISRDTLVLSKTSGAVAVPGALAIGNGNSAAAVELAANEQIADAAFVQVALQGLLDLKSYNERIGPLEGAGSVALGSGTLTTGDSNPSTTFSGTITGSGAVVKTGTATLTLTGTSTYTGNTVVNKGTLLVNGALNANGTVQVASGALGGNGVVGNVVAPFGGRVAPGTSPGQLTTSSLMLSGGDLDVELNGTIPGASYDRLMAGGNVSLGGRLRPTLGTRFTPAQGDTFVILDKTSFGPTAGTFDGLGQGALFVIGGYLFEISYLGGDGNDVELTRVTAPPSQVNTVTALSDGNFQIQGQGWPGLLYTIEATDSLEPPVEWTVVGTAIADENGVFSFTDLGASLHPARFYRVLEP